MKMFNFNVKPGNWCIPLVDNVFDAQDGGLIEIGVYREPDDGSYILQIFYNDDVIVCMTIDVEE